MSKSVKYKYLIKNPIELNTILEIESTGDHRHSALTEMQNVIANDERVKNLPEGELYIAVTYSNDNQEEIGPTNSFKINRGTVSFFEIPYGKDVSK